MPVFFGRCRRVAAGLVAASIAVLLAFPDLALAAPGDWTLSKTPSPTTYSAAGQVITYTYVITNTTSGDGTLFSLTDSKVPAANISCPTSDVPPNGTLTCTGTYTTTAADVAGGNITNTATATGDSCNDGCDVTATAQATVTFIAPPPPPPANGSITIVKTASGGNASFSFTSTVPGAAGFALVTAGGSATRTFSNLAPATYTFTEVNLPLNWRLATLACTGNTGAVTTNLANRSVSIALNGGDAVTCTFGNVFDVGQHQLQTLGVIALFLSHRVQLLTDEPDRNRLIRRMPGVLWGDDGQLGTPAGTGGPFSFSGDSGPLSERMSFATSTSRIAQAHEDAAAKDDLQTLMAFAGAGRAKSTPILKAPPRPVAPESGLDVWVEGHFSRFKADAGSIDSKGSFGIVYLGADYLLTPWLLVGVLAQYDWMTERSQAQALLPLGVPLSRVDGRGWMAGPYMSARLSPNLFFDARAAWGTSDNHVDPFGQYQDTFATNRWLARANLTGNWRFGNFRWTPSAGVTFVEERQRSYTDTLGIAIPSQTVSLGRFDIGPEVAYRFFGSDGTTYEPLVSLKGVWDFRKPDVTAINGLVVGPDEFHAKGQVGVLARAPSGWSLRTVFSYDGIGSNRFHDLGGQIWLNVPFR